MFLRSETLFMRPFWPEERGELRALAGACARAADTFAVGDSDADPLHPQFLLTVPTEAGAPVIGWAAFEPGGEETLLRVWIAEAWRGRGYGSEAMRALLPLARALGHERLVARWPDSGRKGERLLESAGFQRCGRAGQFSVALRDGSACGHDGPGRTRKMAA